MVGGGRVPRRKGLPWGLPGHRPGGTGGQASGAPRGFTPCGADVHPRPGCVFPALHADLCPQPAPCSAGGVRKAQRLGGTWGPLANGALSPGPASSAPSILQPFQSFPRAAGRHERAALGRGRAHRPPPRRAKPGAHPACAVGVGHRRPLVAAGGQSSRTRQPEISDH